MNDKSTTIEQLKIKINKFVEARDWKQFHSPKNISMSIAIEAGELMEHFQWKNDKEIQRELLKKEKLEKIEAEIADVAVYLLELCDIMNIQLSGAIDRKMIENEKKYPVEKSRGNALKYTELHNKNGN